MYLDTKNLTASSTSALTAATASNSKSTRRMRNVWKPLSRLLKVGGKGRTAQATLAHPNNVDLNNTQQQQQQQQQELLIEDDTKSTPEESIHKYGLELRQLPEEEQVSLTQPPNTPTLISSVHVDKVSPLSGYKLQFHIYLITIFQARLNHCAETWFHPPAAKTHQAALVDCTCMGKVHTQKTGACGFLLEFIWEIRAHKKALTPPPPPPAGSPLTPAWLWFSVLCVRVHSNFVRCLGYSRS